MSSEKQKKERREKILLIWDKNKNWYLGLAILFLIISVFNIIICLHQLTTSSKGQLVYVNVTQIHERSPGHKHIKIPKTDIHFTYLQNGKLEEGKIHLTLSYKIKEGDRIPLRKDPESGLFAAPIQKPYMIDLVMSFISLIGCVFVFYFHFFKYKKQIGHLKADQS